MYMLCLAAVCPSRSEKSLTGMISRDCLTSSNANVEVELLLNDFSSLHHVYMWSDILIVLETCSSQSFQKKLDKN